MQVDAESALRLLFIHHSVGGQWLASPGFIEETARCIYTSHPNGGNLRSMLENDGYEVHEASYGSKIGENTDLFDWLPKFSTSMNQILAVDRNDAFYSDNRRNQIVVFKSCYPNSIFNGEGDEAGQQEEGRLTLTNAKAAMRELLAEFRKWPEVLFVYVTAPPVAPAVLREPIWKSFAKTILGRPHLNAEFANSAALARRFNNWVTASDGWLKYYPFMNVAAFDYFDVLTDQGTSNLLRYPTGDGSDSHPSCEGNSKAAAKFVKFLGSAVRRAGLWPAELKI